MYQFDQEDIKVFAFAEGHQLPPSEIGLVIARQGPRPHFILCEIAENGGFHGGKNIIPVCMKARDMFAPELPLSSIAWNYFNGHTSSAFNLTEVNGWPLFIACEHSWPFDIDYHIPSINAYPTILLDVLNSAEIGPEMSATSVILPIDAKNGYISMEWKEPDLSIYPYSKLHLVDTYKFANEWIPLLERGDRELYARFTKEGALKHLVDAYGDRAPFHHPLEMPYLGYAPERDLSFGFINGNHRTLNLIRMGVPFIPMHVSATSEADHKQFEQQYGWAQGDNLTTFPALGFSHFEMF